MADKPPGKGLQGDDEMGYLNREERDIRLAKVHAILKAKDLDLALVYYDEFNIGNGWYIDARK